MKAVINQIAEQLMENLRQTTCVERLQIDIEPQMWFIAESIQQDNVEEELYFYLSDLPKAFGIGSSSWITDASGNVDQHLAYMPFGESFIDQRANGHDIRFKFTGKERDSKTGFDYFGARYYASDLSIWLSVDPMSDERPSLSPYNYCQLNPVMLIDPTGMLDDIVITGEDGSKTTYTPNMEYEGDEFTKQTVDAYNEAYNASEEAKITIDNLVNETDNIYEVIKSEKSMFLGTDIVSFETGEQKPGGGTILWNPEGTELPVQNSAGSTASKMDKFATTDLMHETIHADRHESQNTATGYYGGTKIDEIETCHRENIIRSQMKISLRTHYGVTQNREGKVTGTSGFPLLRYRGGIISNYHYKKYSQIFKGSSKI